MATFRRNKDQEWVVQGTPDEVKVGKVLVEKKDGSKKYVNVVEVGRPFRNDRTGTMMCYGYLKPREEAAQAAPAPEPAPSEPAPVAPEPVEAPSESYVEDSHYAPDDCVF